MKIILNREIKRYLEQIKQIRGVDNIVLTQRDGNPIQFCGVWLSKNEIYNVSAATSAIYNCALELYSDDLKYLLIEGKKAKIILCPLKNYGNDTLNRIIQAQNLQGNNEEFYIAITTQPNVNLGGILLKIRYALSEIKKTLILSGESFKAPLRRFNQQEIQSLLESVDLKDEIHQSDMIPYFSTIISPEFSFKLKCLMKKYSEHILDLRNTFVTLDGGFILSHIEKIPKENHSIESIATMCQSLMTTADKCAWLLKKMHVDSILIECINNLQFIHKVGKNNIFSTEVQKGRQKLGLLRLILPRYTSKISELVKEIKYLDKPTEIPNFESIITELIVSRS